MVDPKRPLTTEEILATITDEYAQEEGYPSAEVYLLECELGGIAGEWRETKEESLIKQYHELFYKLIELGWNPHMLDIEDMLPRDLMPKLPEIIKKHES